MLLMGFILLTLASSCFSLILFSSIYFSSHWLMILCSSVNYVFFCKYYRFLSLIYRFLSSFLLSIYSNLASMFLSLFAFYLECCRCCYRCFSWWILSYSISYNYLCCFSLCSISFFSFCSRFKNLILSISSGEYFDYTILGDYGADSTTL